MTRRRKIGWMERTEKREMALWSKIAKTQTK